MNPDALNRRQLVQRLLGIGQPPWGRLALATGLGVAGSAATVGLLAGSGAVVARAALRPGLGAIAGLLAAVEVVAFLRGPLRYGERLVGHDAVFRVLARWRVWLYDRLEPLSPAGLRAWRSGDLLARAVDDVDELQDLYLRSAPPLIVAATTSVLAIVVVGVLVPPAAAIVGAAVVVALVVPPLLSGAVHSAGERQAALRGAMAADIVDLLEGSADLLAYGRADEVLRRIEEADATLTRGAQRRALAAGLASAVVTVCLGGAVVGVLAVSANAVAHHHLSPVMMAVLPLATVGAFDAIPPVSAAVLRFGEVLAAGRRLLGVQEVPVPVEDPPHPLPLPTGAHQVALEGVRLRYADDLPWALDQVNLRLGVHSHTAVVGRSGAGKSSLVNALLRFWPLASGSSTLDGVDVEALRQDDVRSVFGLLDQEADLFSGTIMDNVVLGRPQASEQEVRQALTTAQLIDWVDSLPQGLGTPVGEAGATVSGGQRQRIALARVLLRGAPVLVLDEPTAGLDRATGARLLADVRGSFGDHTILLVTHRREDLEGFGEVLTMDQGRLAPSHLLHPVAEHPNGRSSPPMEEDGAP